jgi:ammonia channel protein AmtB
LELIILVLAIVGMTVLACTVKAFPGPRLSPDFEPQGIDLGERGEEITSH